MRRARGSGIVVSRVGGFLLVLAAPAGAPCHVGSFVGAPYRVDEGDGKVVITYSNGAGAQPGGTVDYETVDGTAKAPGDYQHTSGTLRWGAAGGTASVAGVNPAYRGFEVPIRQDALDEPAETFTIQMSHFTGCFDAGISEKSATVTIADDDPAPKPKQSAQTSAPPRETPVETPVATPSGSATSSPRESLSPPGSPRPTQTSVPLAGRDSSSGGGISGGALAGIIAGVIVVGGGGALLVRRRFLS